MKVFTVFPRFFVFEPSILHGPINPMDFHLICSFIIPEPKIGNTFVISLVFNYCERGVLVTPKKLSHKIVSETLQTKAFRVICAMARREVKEKMMHDFWRGTKKSRQKNKKTAKRKVASVMHAG